MHAVNKKNKLAYFENCSTRMMHQLMFRGVLDTRDRPLRNLGRNETMLYLLVETKFEQ